MKTRRVYLYAFDKLHRMLDCKFLEGESITIRNIKSLGDWMAGMNPYARSIYAMDNRPGLYREFTESVKASDFVKHIEFEDMVSHEGMLIVSRKETD